MIQGLRKKDLLLFSTPSILASLLGPLAGIVDSAFVGNLSTYWLSALGLATALLSSFTWVFNFLVHASIQGIASSSRDGEKGELKERVFISFAIALGVGVISTVILFLLKEELYFLVGVPLDLATIVDEYFETRLVGHCLTVFFMTQLSVLRGLGHVGTSFNLVCLSTGLNILFSYFFLYQAGLGLFGVALGTVLSELVGVFLCFVLLKKKTNLMKGLIGLRPPLHSWFQFGENSLHIFIRSLALTSCFFIGTRVAAKLGVINLAAHQIILQCWLFTSFFLDGLATTAHILGAQFYGQNKLKRVRLVYRELITLAVYFGLFFSITYIFFSEQIISLFTKDLEVKKAVLNVWPLVAWTQVFSALAFIYDGLIFGLEGFSYLKKHMLIGCIAVFLPFALISLSSNLLWPLWMAFIALNLYRSFSNHFYMKRVLA